VKIEAIRMLLPFCWKEIERGCGDRVLIRNPGCATEWLAHCSNADVTGISAALITPG